jgi:hypothetical protein
MLRVVNGYDVGPTAAQITRDLHGLAIGLSCPSFTSLSSSRGQVITTGERALQHASADSVHRVLLRKDH